MVDVVGHVQQHQGRVGVPGLEELRAGTDERHPGGAGVLIDFFGTLRNQLDGTREGTIKAGHVALPHVGPSQPVPGRPVVGLAFLQDGPMQHFHGIAVHPGLVPGHRRLGS